MGKHAAVLTAVCLLLCLSFNYTFPLHKESTKTTFSDNHSQPSVHEKQARHEGIVERTKQISANIEHALQKFMASTPIKEKIKNATKCSHARHAIYDNDLSNYEQLVIMKKYPFLDLQELDFNNYRPLSNKNARQSLNSAPNIVQDSSFCESLDEVPNVEITNRGLSGFAIPMKLIKTANNPEIKTDMKNAQNVINKQPKMSSKFTTETPDDSRLLKNLEEDIKKFEKFANIG